METHKRGQINKYDTVWFGMLSGIVVPAVVLLLFWYVKFYPTVSLETFFTVQFKPEVIMKIVSLCALPDLLVFYIFTRNNMYKAGRGMIGAVILLIIITLIIKF